MTRPAPPPRPRWVWMVVVGVALGILALLVTHLFMGNPFGGLHAGGVVSRLANAPCA